MQDVVDGAHLCVLLVVGGGAVDDVQQHVGEQRLLERRGESFDELCRQAPDEADRVGEQVAPAVVVEATGRRVERLEQPVLDRHVRAGERVQERRLADVRVPGQGDGRRLRAAPFLALRPAVLLQILQPLPQDRDAMTREPAIRLELRLARATRADPAAEALEVLPHAAHARQVVLELGKLDLQLALGRRRVLREDVEDQLRPVDDARVERVLEEALLGRLELAVDDHALRIRPLEELLQLLDLALADVGSLRRLSAVLHDGADRLDSGRARKLLHLGELCLGIHTLSQHCEDEPALGLRGTWDHRLAIMPASAPVSALAEPTLALVDIPSESRSEEAVHAYLRGQVPLALDLDDGETLLYTKRTGKPLVLLAGHTDTVPAQGNLPGRLEDGAVVGPRRERHERRARGDGRARRAGRRRPSSPTTSRFSSSRARSSGLPRIPSRTCSSPRR